MPHVFHQRPSLDTDTYWASHLGPCWISCKRTWQSSGINFSLCPLLLVNQKITFRKPHNFDKWTMPASMLGTDGSVGWHWKQFAWLVWIMNLAQEAACVDHELGTGSSVCRSWAQHAKHAVHKNQQPWLSLIFQCALSSGRWEVALMWLTFKVLGQETFIKMKNCSLTC